MAILLFTFSYNLVASTAAHNSNRGIVISGLVGATLVFAATMLHVIVPFSLMHRKYIAAQYADIDASAKQCSSVRMTESDRPSHLGI